MAVEFTEDDYDSAYESNLDTWVLRRSSVEYCIWHTEDRDRNSLTTSVASSVYAYRKENGRTYHAYKDGSKHV